MAGVGTCCGQLRLPVAKQDACVQMRIGIQTVNALQIAAKDQ